MDAFRSRSLYLFIKLKLGIIMKLADALLRRKELQQKVDQIRSVKQADVFENVIHLTC